METDRIKQFRTIVDAGGLIKASQVLGITASGLSKSMKTLEKQIGFNLFFPAGRGVDLTEKGRVFYEKSASIVELVEDLFSADVRRNDAIRVVTFEVFSSYFFANFIKENNISQAVTLQEAIPGKMEKLIADHICDIGITYDPIPYPGVEFIKVGKVTSSIFVAKNFQNLDRFDGEIPFVIPILPYDISPSDMRGLDGWPEHKFPRNSKYKVEMLQSALEIAAKGLACAFIPCFVAELFNKDRISARRLEERSELVPFKNSSRPVYIVTRRNYEVSSFLQHLERSLKKLS